jgi:hypothetical protein
MSSSLGYSELSDLESKKSINSNNKTKKNRENFSNKTKITHEFLSTKNNNNVQETSDTPVSAFEEEEEDNVDDSMFDSQEEQPRDIVDHPIPARMHGKEEDNFFKTNENDHGLPDSNMVQQYNQYKNFSNKTPMHYGTNNIEPMQNSDSELNQKLTYMIHLLEEQHDEKVKSVTEEVILYGFFGVFVIYVLDSFTKIGKYVR